MDLTYQIAPGDLLWAQAAFDLIQGVKAGTFDLSAAYQQFSFLVLPQLTVSGAHGNNDVFVSLKIDNFGVLKHIDTNSKTSVLGHRSLLERLRWLDIFRISGFRAITTHMIRL